MPLKTGLWLPYFLFQVFCGDKSSILGFSTQYSVCGVLIYTLKWGFHSLTCHVPFNSDLFIWGTKSISHLFLQLSFGKRVYRVRSDEFTHFCGGDCLYWGVTIIWLSGKLISIKILLLWRTTQDSLRMKLIYLNGNYRILMLNFKSK